MQVNVGELNTEISEIREKKFYRIGFLKEKCYRRKAIPPWANPAGNEQLEGEVNMSESGQIITAICVLIAVYMLTRKVSAWRIKRAYMRIIKDLEKREAFDETSAIALPYVNKGIFRVGVRDFRPKALQFLVASDIVGMTQAGKYYLKKRDVEFLNSD